jgi:hypothetical protein
VDGAVLVRPCQRAVGQIDRPAAQARDLAGDAQHGGVLFQMVALLRRPSRAVHQQGRQSERQSKEEKGEQQFNGHDRYRVCRPRIPAGAPVD